MWGKRKFGKSSSIIEDRSERYLKKREQGRSRRKIIIFTE
jgi:hypothetical protein